MYLLVVKNDVRKPDFFGADVNCFDAAILRCIPLQEMIVPILIKIENVLNFDLPDPLFIFLALFILRVSYSPFSPKYCSQGLDLFQSVVTSNKY